MSRNGNHRTNESRRAKTFVIQNLVFAALFLLSLFGNAIESRADHGQIAGEEICLESHDPGTPLSHDADLPCNSKATLPVESPGAELDSQKETDDNDGNEYAHQSASYTIAVIFTQSSYWQCCAELSQNHDGVSLFILYHSWKSYLS